MLQFISSVYLNILCLDECNCVMLPNIDKPAFKLITFTRSLQIRKKLLVCFRNLCCVFLSCPSALDHRTKSVQTLQFKIYLNIFLHVPSSFKVRWKMKYKMYFETKLAFLWNLFFHMSLKSYIQIRLDILSVYTLKELRKIFQFSNASFNDSKSDSS